jgi:hypothetical protein
LIKRIEKIPKESVNENQGLVHEEELNKEFNDLLSKNLQMKEKLEELTLVKERMANIIEICEINSHQNEKWIIVGLW